MAQQIDFISLSQQAFDNLVSANTVQSSRLYFTSDTHRIYKGADLYAATDFDQITFSNLQASSLTVNGSAVALDGHTHSINDVTNLSTTLSGITQTAITKTNGSFSGTLSANTISGANATFTGTVSASTGKFTSLNVGNSAVALSGHTHVKSDITDFSHTHSINDVTNLSASLTGITQDNISKSGYVSAPTISGTTVKGGTGSFTTVSAGTVSATTGSFSTLNVNGTSVAVVGHSHSAADLSGITFDEMTVDQFVASSVTVDGKSVVLYGDVTGGTSYQTTSGVTVSVTIAANTAQPTITLTGVGAAASKSVATASASMTTTYGSYLPTVTAVKSYVDATKASKGTATAAAFKGLRASVSMNSNTAPTMAFYNDSIVTVSTNIANNAANDKFITASAVAAYVDGKMAGGGTVVGGTTSDADAGVFVSLRVDENATPYIDVNVNALTNMDDDSINSDSLVTASAIAQYINNKVSAAIESALGVVLSSQY